MAKKPKAATELPRRDKQIVVRVTLEEREALKITATAAGMKTADWVRRQVLPMTKETA